MYCSKALDAKIVCRGAMKHDKTRTVLDADTKHCLAWVVGAATCLAALIAMSWLAVHVAVGRVTAHALHPTSGWVVNEIARRQRARAEALAWLQGHVRLPNFCPPARTVESDPAAVPSPFAHVQALQLASEAPQCSWRNLTALDPITDLPLSPRPPGGKVPQCACQGLGARGLVCVAADLVAPQSQRAYSHRLPPHFPYILTWRAHALRCTGVPAFLNPGSKGVRADGDFTPHSAGGALTSADHMLLGAAGPCTSRRPVLVSVAGGAGATALLAAVAGCRVIAIEAL